MKTKIWYNKINKLIKWKLKIKIKNYIKSDIKKTNIWYINNGTGFLIIKMMK